MAKLMTWDLADALADALATDIGNFKLHTFSGTAPAANGYYTPAVADALAQAFMDTMGDFNIVLFTGTQPATSTALAGNLTTYTKLVRFQATVEETGTYPLHWAALVAGSGTASSDTTQAGTGTASASGTATWGCIVPVADTLGADSNAIRYCFSVGTSGADANLASATFASGTAYPLAVGTALTVPFANISTALYGAIGTPLVSYSDGVDGIDWDAVVAGTGSVGRLMSEGVYGTASATGDQAWGVIAPYADTLASSSSAKRLLFTIGTAGSGAGAVMQSVSVVSGATVPFAAGITFSVGNTA